MRRMIVLVGIVIVAGPCAPAADWSGGLGRAGATAGEIQALAAELADLPPAIRTVREEGLAEFPPARLRTLLASRRTQRGLDAFEQLPLPESGDREATAAPADLRRVAIPNATVESVFVAPSGESCLVTVVVSHPPADDQVRVFIGLPLKGWNGRFLGTGGGGFHGGNPDAFAVPLRQGFAVGATDTGHPGDSGSFALAADGRLDWQSIRDNAYLGIHDLSVVGKALVRACYGRAPAHSYFFGCSTGGRQGLSEAQRYPDDFDGIVSGCPAINWAKFVPALLWPQVVMLEDHDLVPKSKLVAATEAAIRAGRPSDGLMDGYYADPRKCTYDPGQLVGTMVDGSRFTEADADVIRRIWEGPRRRDGSFLWYGLQRGADLTVLAGSEGTPPHGVPHRVGVDYGRYYLMQNPRWRWESLTRDQFELLWDQSAEEFESVLGTDHPDLTAFRDRGGKLIVWHGWSDTQIPPEGTLDYYDRVRRTMGGDSALGPFLRLFMAPGVGHCSGGNGPQPAGLLTAIVRWVEQGSAPERLTGVRFDANGVELGTRPLLPYR